MEFDTLSLIIIEILLFLCGILMVYANYQDLFIQDWKEDQNDFKRISK